MSQNFKPYNDAFYKRRGSWRADYLAISEWIADNIDGQIVGDIGCGNGLIIEDLLGRGRKVWGVDGAVNLNKHVAKKVSKSVTKADLTKPKKLTKSDILVCLDVADRLDQKHLETFMKNIVSTNATTILFTASGPGQAGIHHINLQEPDYWLDAFSKHGYLQDVALTQKFKADLSDKLKNLEWYPKDILVLHKYDYATLAKAYDAAGQTITELNQKIDQLKNEKATMFEEYYHTAQHLNRILNSTRWKAMNKALKVLRK